MRRRDPVTKPTKCRSCGADVLWGEWERSQKKMPVDAVADQRPPPNGGTLVLTLRGGEYGTLLVEKFDPARHDAKRNRYTSHFATCPNADEHRKAR
ncbi:MAG: hypothetical protein WAZ94_15145 [Phycisphaerales bacterium]|nr:hypothetical protein [Chloroflexota bacterium]